MVAYGPEDCLDRAPTADVQLVVRARSKAEILFQGLCMDDTRPDERDLQSVDQDVHPFNQSRLDLEK